MSPPCGWAECSRVEVPARGTIQRHPRTSSTHAHPRRPRVHLKPTKGRSLGDFKRKRGCSAIWPGTLEGANSDIAGNSSVLLQGVGCAAAAPTDVRSPLGTWLGRRLCGQFLVLQWGRISEICTTRTERGLGWLAIR